MKKRLFKRGISPLIATMLLIALAVSIGVTVISFGGLYIEKVRIEGAECLDVQIKAFGLDDQSSQCRNYGSEPIFNFYPADEQVIEPKCYTEIATGKGNICPPGIFLNSTWVTTNAVIR